MTKRKLINRTLETLEKLPKDRVHEVADYADYIFKKYEEQTLQKGLETLVSQSESFAFLHDEEELYDESDLKETYE